MKPSTLKKSGLQRVKSGHPWLRADDIQDRSTLPKRAGVFFLAEHWWLYSPESYLRLRRLGPAKKNWMQNSAFNYLSNADQFRSYFGLWLKTHLSELLVHKIKILSIEQEDLCLRWVFSENDEIPGLIVDIFGNTLACQINSAPIELFWFFIKELLIACFTEVTGQQPVVIELRNGSVRQKEGLAVIPAENEGDSKNLRWNGWTWQMTPGLAQKTGAYFDQRYNHMLAAQYVKKYKIKTAWDLCCYQGGFALHMLGAGAHVLALDQSQPALLATEKNVQLNALPEKNIQFVTDDVFAWLRKQSPQQFVDMIVLDPPSFVKNRQNIAPAIKGLTELNALAMQHLNPGGLLLTCVCSHHISESDFTKSLTTAAQVAKTKMLPLETTGPSPDHTPAANFPEGRYLQCRILQKSP